MKSCKIKISGRVQGVGFRPFVYRLAKSLDLTGWVLNSTGSVEILIQGSEANIRNFIDALIHDPPPLSHIENIFEEIVEESTYTDFSIIKSREDKGFNFISPDIAICDDCLRELRDPHDRRFGYPFINCTNCGPRYTIIEDLPYDREKTTMKVFKMCEVCNEEYHNPLSRRFHAQPDACSVCGPHLWIDSLNIPESNLFKEIGKLLYEGQILAIKGIGGFHIACDATNESAVERLRNNKKRRSKPFALMMKDLDMIRRYCYVNNTEEKILRGKERPIVLLRIKDYLDLSPSIAPGNLYLGVMLPYAPYHYLIFDDFDRPIVMTSGNLSEEPIIKDNVEAKDKLKNIVDNFVLHNRNIRNRIDDSVVFVEDNDLTFVRRARGYAPDPLKVSIEVDPVLALGPELKNTFAIGSGNYVFMSPHIGDLKDLETLDVFEETIEDFIHLFRINPEVLVHDLHPQYLSTEFAEKFKSFMKVVPVQHHRAHILSLLLDRDIGDPIIGFSFDGTGFGEDGNIWGGEVFVGNLRELHRAAHFKYFPMAGGDYSIENPKRIAYSYLFSNEIEDNGNYLPISPLEKDIIKSMIQNKKNIFYTSSCGRIFDMVSAILGVRSVIDYEGQAAVELEMCAMDSDTSAVYPFEIQKGSSLEIDILPMIKKILEDRQHINRSIIARQFHNTIAYIILSTAEILREKYHINKVGLSGGVFQNRLLLNILSPLLKESKFEVYTHRRIPPNDGGISLGQIALAMKGV